MPDSLLTHLPAKVQPKAKKTLGDLLDDGQVKTGKDLLDEKARLVKAQEEFALAAQEEARLQRSKRR